jgi:hypothetical protein
MALNLLQGASIPVEEPKNTDDDVIEDFRERKFVRVGRSLEEARELVERSFGNYVGSEVRGLRCSGVRVQGLGVRGQGLGI